MTDAPLKVSHAACAESASSAAWIEAPSSGAACHASTRGSRSGVARTSRSIVASSAHCSRSSAYEAASRRSGSALREGTNTTAETGSTARTWRTTLSMVRSPHEVGAGDATGVACGSVLRWVVMVTGPPPDIHHRRGRAVSPAAAAQALSGSAGAAAWSPRGRRRFRTISQITPITIVAATA